MVYKMISLLNLANSGLIQKLSHSVANEKDLENLKTSGWLKDDLNKDVFFIYSENSSDILASLMIYMASDPWLDDDHNSQKLSISQVSRYITIALACASNDYEVNVIRTISKMLMTFVNDLTCEVNNIQFNNNGSETQLLISLVKNSYLLDISLNIGSSPFISDTAIVDKYKLFVTSQGTFKNDFNFSVINNGKVNKVASIFKTLSSVEYGHANPFNKNSLLGIKPIIDGHEFITIDFIEALIKEIQNKETKKLKLIKITCFNHYQKINRDLISIVLCSPDNVWNITIHV
ncbi:hypothetical protein [Pseudomonas phage U1B]|nr:hypothetical protein [Pseudomonas phage T2P]QYV99203.1 hypothetical protein [Pseudomonas phage U1B]QYV99659.1 hypothetical protein [Pseudomonas phage U5]